MPLLPISQFQNLDTIMLKFALFSLAEAAIPFLKYAKANDCLPTILVSPHPQMYNEEKIIVLHKDDPQLIQKLKDAGIECLFTCSWKEKIKVDQYEWLPKGAWNVHSSFLPKYRGANPYFWVLAHGESETGVTVHQLTPEFDEGPILLQTKVKIEADDTIESLFHHLTALDGPAIKKSLSLIERGKYKLTPQKEGPHPKAPLVSNDVLTLKPSLTKAQAKNLVRAANPYFGSILNLNDKTIEVFGVSESEDGPSIPCQDGELKATLIKVPKYGYVTGKDYLRLFPT